MIEVEVQNESDQTEKKLNFVNVPRIGESVRLVDDQGFKAAYDVLDVWYQEADFGGVWIPFIHVRKTP